MGRKSRAKHSVKPPTTSAYTNKKEVDRLIQKLLNVCVQMTTRKNEWENYMEIQFLVERIRQYQSNKSLTGQDRLKNLSRFQDWLKENNVVLNDIAIEYYGSELGLGVKATSDIKREAELTFIPYDIMMTSDKASESCLGDLIKSRKMLSELPNVGLALYLHCERLNPDSIYKPYIDILPSEYNTVLYFSTQEMESLRGSSALSAAIAQYKSIARQYGIFFNLMHTEHVVPEVQKIPIIARNEFTFDAYRWAVSTVSTRQNRIAIMTREEREAISKMMKPGEERDIKDSTLALIPMWDMFNHSLGQLSTDCDPKEKFCKSYAMRDFKAGEQVTICYGARSNVDFLVSNGFIYEKNPFDKVEVQFGVSPNDKLYQKKVQLLEKLRMKPSGSFYIYAMPDSMPTSPDLLAFLRVFHMTEEELDGWLTEDMRRGPRGLKEIYMPYTLGTAAEGKMWTFLENRIALLLRGFKKTPEEVAKILESKDTNERMKLAIRMQLESKRVLTACHEFCKWFPLNLERNAEIEESRQESRSGARLRVIPKITEITEETEEEMEGEEVVDDFEGGERDTDVGDVVLLNKYMKKKIVPQKNENGAEDVAVGDNAISEVLDSAEDEPSVQELTIKDTNE